MTRFRTRVRLPWLCGWPATSSHSGNAAIRAPPHRTDPTQPPTRGGGAVSHASHTLVCSMCVWCEQRRRPLRARGADQPGVERRGAAQGVPRTGAAPAPRQARAALPRGDEGLPIPHERLRSAHRARTCAGCQEGQGRPYGRAEQRRLLPDKGVVSTVRRPLGRRGVGAAAVRVHVPHAGAPHIRLLHVPASLRLHVGRPPLPALRRRVCIPPEEVPRKSALYALQRRTLWLQTVHDWPSHRGSSAGRAAREGGHATEAERCRCGAAAAGWRR